MTDNFDAIFLSPHYDDAAFSCGGQIFELTSKGKQVLIVTVMGGDPPALPAAGAVSAYVESLHDRWQTDIDPVGVRRAEDVAACQVLGADWLHLEFPDCIYRTEPGTGRPLYTSDADIFGEIYPAEMELVERIISRLERLPACQALFVPLTLGHHVDHQQTRQAAEALHPATPLYYYEDFPYARQVSALQFVSDEGGIWQPDVIELSAQAAAARIRATSCYKSQMSTFFQDSAELAEAVTAYMRAVGGERLWTRTNLDSG